MTNLEYDVMSFILDHQNEEIGKQLQELINNRVNIDIIHNKIEEFKSNSFNMVEEVKVSNDKGFETRTAEITSANILEVEVGTTGYMGGDSGHGGKTYFRLKDLASTDLNVGCNIDKYGSQEVVIELGGDTELQTFIEALKYTVKVLEEQSQEA
jgi:hypothetical protein